MCKSLLEDGTFIWFSLYETICSFINAKPDDSAAVLNCGLFIAPDKTRIGQIPK